VPGAAYKKGDIIGQKCVVYGVLGAGGFSIVCLAYARELGGALALKTFRDEYLADTQTRGRFRQEASVWGLSGTVTVFASPASAARIPPVI